MQRHSCDHYMESSVKRRGDIYSRVRWCRYFFDLARRTAEMSKDPSTKVGCVIVEPTTNQILSTGFNGFARGVYDLEERYNDRDLKYEMVVHAEMNAIAHAAMIGVSLNGSSVFVTFPICARCAALMIQVGVKEVYCLSIPDGKETSEKWKMSNEIADIMFSEAKISLCQIEVSSLSNRLDKK